MQNDPEFLFQLHFFSRIMPHVGILLGKLQTRAATTLIVQQHSLSNFTDAVQKTRESINVEHASTPKQRNEEDKITYAKKFYDVILLQSRERFSFRNHLEANKVLCLSYAFTFNIYFPEKFLEKSTAAYSMLDKVKLRTELCVLYSR